MTIELNHRERAGVESVTAPAVLTFRPVPRSAPVPISWMRPELDLGYHPELPWSTEDTDDDPPHVASGPIRAMSESGHRTASGHRAEQHTQPSEIGSSLPNPVEWSGWLAQLLVEVVHGRRPVNQLARWTEERVLATVVLRSRQLRYGPRRPGGPAGPTALGSVRVQCPTAHAVEATAVIRGPRASALAFRLEARGDRWLCTAIDFGPQTPQPV